MSRPRVCAIAATERQVGRAKREGVRARLCGRARSRRLADRVRGPGRAAAATLLAMLLLGALPATLTAQGAPAAGRLVPRAGDRVAVVPFVNISALPADDWIGAGFAETVAVDLERVADLAAVDGDIEGGLLPRDVGRRLGTPWVVSGAYQRVGERVRITARLVHVETGTVARTANVTGRLRELFTLQDRIAAALTEDDPAAIAERPAAPPEPGPPPGIVLPGGDRPMAPPGAPVAVGRAPVLAAGVIDGPPAPLPPEVLNRGADGRATLLAHRLSAELNLDGSLDEAVYSEIRGAGGFVQQFPIEGAPATEDTEVWVFYDDENVYVGMRCWDSAPEDQWIANEMQRDSFQLIQNDRVAVAFDTFYDRRNGMAFMVNPIGGFFDFEISDEGNPNTDWNTVWDVRTGRFEGGWSAEMQIPFKSLRFQQGRSQLWGIQFERQVRRKNETSHLTPVPIAVGPGIFRLSAAATLAGLEVASENRRLEVKPYAIGSSATDLTASPPFTNRGDGDAGIDAKWGVTQNLTADFTYNTDFAQVEVDEQQVNLTRFSLFFPEKREFFLEARGIFDFGAGPNLIGTGGGGNNGGRLQGPPGTRAGNEAPLVFFSRRIGLQEGRTVPIVGGGRLTGKVGRLSIGALNMQTADAPDADALATNFTVVRVKQDILRRSRIGAIFTRRSVSLDRNGENDVYGADASFAFHDNVTFNGYYARTRTYGREGNDASYQGQFTYDADLFGLQAEHLLVGENFNPEVGFLRRQDFRRSFVAAHYRPRPRGIEAIRQFTFGGSVDYIENGARDLETRGIGGKFITEFENSDRLTVDLLRSYELLVEPFEIASNVAIPIGAYDFQDVFLSYFMGQQRQVSGTAFVQQGTFFGGDLTGFGYRQGRIGLTPRMSIEPTVQINRINLPEGRFTATVATTRATYTFTARMFLSALVQYNSAVEQMGTNVRFRWEYSPGSELFVVYNDQRDTTLRPGRLPLLENRAFIVKFTRLLRF